MSVPLRFDWITNDPRVSARVLSLAGIDALLARPRDLPPDRRMAVSTYLDAIAQFTKHQAESLE
jgi:hypothetical protein